MSQGDNVMRALIASGKIQGNKAKLESLLAEEAYANYREELKQFCKATLDPTFNYYMTKKGIPAARDYKLALGDMTPDFCGLLRLLNALATRVYTGKAAEEVVAQWLFNADPAHRWLFTTAISRALPGNIGTTMVNQVWPGLIYKQPYPKCSSWDPDKVSKMFDWSLYPQWERKEDGMCILMNFRDNSIRTRQGQDVTAQMMPYLNPVMLEFQLSGAEDYVAQFEAKMYGDDWELLPRPEANGIYNAIFKSNRKVEAGKMQLILLDLIPAAEFYGEVEASMPQVSRRELMMHVTDAWNVADMNSSWGSNWPQVKPVYACDVTSLEEARRLTQDEIFRGGEGCILKDPGAVWNAGKMKMKNEFETTLVCRGIKPHSRNPEWVGSVLLESSDGLISTYAGSGLNEEDGSPLDRRRPDQFLNGSLWEVRAEKISKNNALDLPRLIEPRTDKDRADSYEEVVAAYMDSIAVKEV